MNNLNAFNISLKKLRDEFHKSGKFNDSNAKLDEISKLLAIELHDITNDENNTWIKNIISEYKIKGIDLVQVLKRKFSKIAKDDMFITTDKQNIFGLNPSLDLDSIDNEFAFEILNLLVHFFDNVSKEDKFDFLNEAFGHFIRDNFRSNIEDAQYMTPQEVVDLMCNIGYAEMFKSNKTKSLTVCDPCCGVGSFITSFYRKMKEHNNKSQIHLIGQDKVPRMVRLTKLNLNSIYSANHELFTGNSLIGKTMLDKYENKVDLILTNPPFGAKFKSSELAPERLSKYPLLNDLFNSSLNFSSEILFIDRCVSLLKEGGHMLAVVPDSVISSKGIAETLRHRIISSNSLQLVSLIELPTVTFAQAGTRTKTTILHFTKTKTKKPFPIFIAKSNYIGFEVSVRKGVNIKVQHGENDLPVIYQSYIQGRNAGLKVNQHMIVSKNPSSVYVNSDLISKGTWTPNHYEANKFEIIDSFKANSDFELVPLHAIADVITDIRRKDKKELGSKCISVLHVVNNDLLDYHELLQYNPKYSGIVCKPGDLLFSKINPRIPRVIVVPDLEINLTCSSEFEIIQGKSGFSNYDLKMLLLLPSVQVQINHLTSGTSSSHNRIKTKELMNIQLPIPKKNSIIAKDFTNLLNKSRDIYESALLLNINKVKLNESISRMVKISI